MRRKKETLLLLFACLTSFLQIRGQNTDALIQEFISAYQKGSVSSVLARQILNRDEKEALMLLQKYHSDKNDRVREASWYLTAAVGRKTGDSDIRKNVLMQLIQGSGDPVPWVANKNLAQLKNFNRSMFDEQVQKALEKLYKTTTNPTAELIKIIGFSGCRSLIPDLQKRARGKEEKNPQIQWACNLALARMDDKEAIRYCIKRIRQLPVNDETIEDAFPDLIYIRNKEAFDYLLEVAADRSSQCTSSNPDNVQAMPCTAKILEMIAPYLVGFPVHYDAGLSTLSSEETIALVSNWMKEKYNADAILQDLY